MDLSFHKRRRPARPAEPDALDYRSIVAALAAVQAACPAALAAMRLAAGDEAVPPRDVALAVLFLNEPGWLRAAAILDGSFDALLAGKFVPNRS